MKSLIEQEWEKEQIREKQEKEQLDKHNEEPLLESAQFEFSQESNCVDGGDIESLKIRLESSLGVDRDGGGFFVLKTEQWSIDSVDDLQKLFDRINNIVKK